MIKNNKYLINTPNGWQPFDGIKKVEKKISLNIILETDKINCTYEHPFISDNKIIKAKELKKGMYIDTKGGKQKVIGIHNIKGKCINFFDVLEVGGNHTYYANNIVNHNCNFLGSSNTLIEG